MMFDGPLDLFAVDRAVARASKVLDSELAHLKTDDGRLHARVGDPFHAVREVTVQSTFQSLRELKPGPTHEAHRAGLLRWVHELLQARVSWELLVDEADSLHARDPSARTAARASGAAAPTDSSNDPPMTFEEGRRALLAACAASAAVPAALALGRMADLASPVVAVRRELRTRRFEAARRLGLAHPWALVLDGGSPKLEALARAVLDATEPLAKSLQKDLRRRVGAEVSPAHAILDGLAVDALEGWPAHLTTRWFEEVFRAVARRPPGDVRLPDAIGGASFLRAAVTWGVALRRAGVARTLPFALASDPYPTEGYTLGGALAVVIADRVFAKKKLGLPARAADAHTRALERALLAGLRHVAALVLGGIDETLRADTADELGARVFGAPLPGALGAAWASGGLGGAARIDAPARLLGAVRAHGLVRGWVDRYDDDWFDNPRAGGQLSAMSVGPMWASELPDDDAVRQIARGFEETLG